MFPSPCRERYSYNVPALHYLTADCKMHFRAFQMEWCVCPTSLRLLNTEHKISTEVELYIKERLNCSPATFNKSYQFFEVIHSCRTLMPALRPLQFEGNLEQCNTPTIIWLTTLQNNTATDADKHICPNPLLALGQDASQVTEES